MGSNIYILHLLPFAESSLFNAFLRKVKTGFGIAMGKSAGCGILV